MALCEKLSTSDCLIKVVNSRWLCRYHQNKTEFPIKRLTSSGLCPEAFHSFYPLVFSMLYVDVNNHITQASCPGTNGNILFQLSQKPLPLMHKLCNVIKKLISFIFPLEIIHHNVFIEVKRPNSACPYNYREGDLFVFNIGEEKSICPAAFYNIFPSIIPNVYLDCNVGEAGKLSNSLVYVCPDHRQNILFKLQNKKETTTNISTIKDYQCCKPIGNLMIDVEAVTGTCSKAYKTNDQFKLSDILKDLNFPCLTALHTAYPYIYTLLKGGKLGFYTRDYDSAIIQCPNVDVKIEMKVKKTNKDEILIKILYLKSDCPNGLTKTQEFIFSFKQLNRFCLSALMAMYPYLIQYDKFLKQEICCPGQKGKVYFSIHNL